MITAALYHRNTSGTRSRCRGLIRAVWLALFAQPWAPGGHGKRKWRPDISRKEKLPSGGWEFSGMVISHLFFATAAAAAGRFLFLLLLHAAFRGAGRAFFGFAASVLGGAAFFAFEYCHGVSPLLWFVGWRL